MKRVLFTSLVLGSAALAVWVFILVTTPKDAQLYFMNVGQGDATLFESKGGFRALVDTGKDSTVVSRLDAILPIYDRSIDMLFITHPDTDHFGGALSVLARYNVRLVVLNGDYDSKDSWDGFMAEINAKHVPIFVAHSGDEIHTGDSTISVLWPSGEYMQRNQNNESSLVLLVRSEDIKTLFPGDITMSEENALAASGLDVDILHLAHHGSRYATSENFLRTITPTYGIIQVGKNTYGHPSGEVLTRLEENSIPFFRNDEQGTIHARLRDGNVSIFTEK
jgi:competence protein ComEC